jgi:hypothetical protein
MIALAHSAAMFGVDGYVVRIEADSPAGTPSFSLIGLPDRALGESRDRVRAGSNAAVLLADEVTSAAETKAPIQDPHVHAVPLSPVPAAPIGRSRGKLNEVCGRKPNQIEAFSKQTPGWNIPLCQASHWTSHHSLQR